MISAFGVEHGEISKGLPRYLKNISPGVQASGSRKFRGGEPLSRGDYTYLRIRANQHGKHASRLNSEWEKIPKKWENTGRLEQKRAEVVVAATKGRLGREGSRKAIADNTPIVRPKRRRR